VQQKEKSPSDPPTSRLLLAGPFQQVTIRVEIMLNAFNSAKY
jgi:hypothetical protein